MQTNFYCNNPYINIYERPSINSKISSQIIYGEKFKVIKNNYLEDLGVFTVINPGVPDGFSVDFLGNIYTSSWDSIQIFSPSGENIGKIDIPEKVSNCCFGGADKKTLYITASSRLYSIRLKVNGI